MTPNDFVVAPRRFENIDNFADDLRDVLKMGNVHSFPVMHVAEKVLSEKLGLFELRVDEDESMEGYEAYTSLDGKEIVLRESVYHGAYEGKARDRFTVAHELGHRFLHASPDMKLARGVAIGQKIKPYRSGEAQANRFAAALLMPSQCISCDDSPYDLVKRFGVSMSAAKCRLRSLCITKGGLGPLT